MESRRSPHLVSLGALAALALLLTPLAIAEGQKAPAASERPAESFELRNLNPAAGGSARVRLEQRIGTRPVILYYWIAGNPRADRVFRELEQLVGELEPGRVELFGLALPRPGRGVDVIQARLADLGIRVPVLEDEDFRLGRQLGVQSVPNVSLFDAQGRLRLTNGATLSQQLEYKVTLADAIRRLARTGSLTAYGYLPRYYPVNELVGKPCPDFRAPLLTDDVERRWHHMLDGKKINVLVFWSIDCPHCRRSLPEINDWLKANSAGINLVSAAKVTDEQSRKQTREFCELNGFVFPTLVDRDLQIAHLYQVTTTPTVLIIGPDGVVDSVLVSGDEDVGRALEKKKRELLKG